jgi:HAMP domain-containing protein
MAPTILLETLESLRRRVRILGIAFGLGLAASAAVGLLLFTVFADYLLNLPALPRLGLILAAIAAIGFALWRWVIQPILARLTLNDVAGRVERTFPQYQDRLRSTIDILSGNAPPGSDIMKARIVSEATRLTQSLDLNQVVVAGPVWYSTAGGLLAIGLLGLIVSFMGPNYTRVALDRLFSPFAAHPWPKSVNIDMVGSVPERVSVGQRIDVNIRLTKGDSASRKAVIYYAYGDGTHFGPTEKEYMTRGEDGIYHAGVDARIPGDAAAGVVKIWMESGDDSHEITPIKVVQRLAITRVEAVITAPPYANLPQTHVNLAQNPGMLTFGSKVQLNVLFNKPLDSSKPVTAEIISSKAHPAFNWAASSGNADSATVDAPESFAFHLHATDVDGLTNTAAEEYRFEVRPDANPTVTIETPGRNQDNTPEAVVALQARAEDDFGIDSLTLVVDRVNDKKHWEIPLVTKSGPTAGVQWVATDATGSMLGYRANYSWELNQLKDANLKSGDVLEYYALVKDNFELNGKSHEAVPSSKFRIAIVSQEEFNNKITDMLATVAEQTAALRQSQLTTKTQTSELAKEVAGKPQMDNADKTAADRLANQQSTITSQTNSLGQKMGDIQKQMDQNRSNNAELKSTVKDVGELLNSTAEHPMKDAANDIGNAKQSPQKDQRDQQLSDAQASQGKAADDLQNVLNRMGPIGQLQRSIDAVTQLLHDQQKISADTADAAKGNLGKTPDQMSPADRAKMEAIAKQQGDLADRTAKTLDQLAKDADKLNKSDPTAAKAMQQAADTGQQQNVPGQQKKASDAEQQNQQSTGQAAQKQAELGLQMMLADLREAEKHKLDELARKLAELQQQVAILLRQQSEHNLDNLTLQGNDVLTAISADTKLQLYTLSQRDPKATPVPVDLGMLSSGQEQTERNTRDIAKAAQDLPDGAGPADHLTKAADKMERAIVNLRDNKLATAYNPAQVDALAALLDAKKIIDEQKKKADDKQDQQKKEVIRQAYMAILAEQNEVNLKTTAIDQVAKNDDGSLPREAQIRLNNTASDQGKVSDKTAKLDEALQSLGSIVYSYANRSIVKEMTQSKDQLGHSQTGAVEQVLQKQIVAELDAVIRDLATKPEESQFAQHAGGGGSGGGAGSPGMPTEAELRLMKDLQLAENDATKSIAQQPNPQKGDFLSLGNRQGDLRNLLDQLLQKASHNQTKLPPEPDNKDQLPEEAAKTPGGAAEAVDNKEMQDDLLGGNTKPAKAGGETAAPPEAQHDLNLVGDRMARSRQRLAINSDAGPVTQEIQKRILDNLDDLIEQARQREAKAQNQPPKPGGDPSDAKKPGDQQQPQNSQAQGKPQQGKPQQASASSGSGSGGGDGKPGDPAADFAKQEAQMWGSPTPRQRQAVIENKTEKVLDKYQKLVDDYYRAMSVKANAH